MIPSSTNLCTQNARHALQQRHDDMYETPAVATLALIDNEPLPRAIWEPACGRGAIVNVLRQAGHRVIASDLVDYGAPIAPPVFYCRDFLMEREPFGGAIVTNPPFKLAQQFVAKALELAPKVVMLARLGFLETERRRPILDNGMLARVLVFRNRLPRMHREGWTGRRNNHSAMAFAWFVWERDHRGPAELRRISWKKRTIA